jgi:hypothetical protein
MIWMLQTLSLTASERSKGCIIFSIFGLIMTSLVPLRVSQEIVKYGDHVYSSWIFPPSHLHFISSTKNSLCPICQNSLYPVALFPPSQILISLIWKMKMMMQTFLIKRHPLFLHPHPHQSFTVLLPPIRTTWSFKRTSISTTRRTKRYRTLGLTMKGKTGRTCSGSLQGEL